LIARPGDLIAPDLSWGRRRANGDGYDHAQDESKHGALMSIFEFINSEAELLSGEGLRFVTTCSGCFLKESVRLKAKSVFDVIRDPSGLERG
jgi:hypothetical protein